MSVDVGGQVSEPKLPLSNYVSRIWEIDGNSIYSVGFRSVYDY